MKLVDQPDVTVLPQGDVGLLDSAVAQRLLVSTELARLAYVAGDGTPRSRRHARRDRPPRHPDGTTRRAPELGRRPGLPDPPAEWQ
jgi:hypothetical protein